MVFTQRIKLALAGCLLALSAQAQTWKQERNVRDFDRLSVSSGIDVVLTQGNSERLTLDVNGFDEDEVRAEVRNGVLKLYVDRKGGWFNWGRNKTVKAYLTFRQLRGLQTSGGADIEQNSALTFDKFEIQASGGSDIDLDLRAASLNVQASGGADVNLKGQTRQADFSVSGGADLDASRLRAEVCHAQASGGADATVYASQEFHLQASGGADVTYIGPGRVVSQSKSGAGDITRR